MKFLLVIATLASLYAQTRLQTSNAHGWWNNFSDHPMRNTKWGLHLEGQWRRHDIVTKWQQLLIRPAVNYTIHPNITLTVGYGFIATSRYGEYPVSAAFPEHRVRELGRLPFHPMAAAASPEGVTRTAFAICTGL
jgi:hypothetical protein